GIVLGLLCHGGVACRHGHRMGAGTRGALAAASTARHAAPDHPGRAWCPTRHPASYARRWPAPAVTTCCDSTPGRRGSTPSPSPPRPVRRYAPPRRRCSTPCASRIWVWSCPPPARPRGTITLHHEWQSTLLVTNGARL